MNFIKKILKKIEVEKTLMALHEESKKEFCECGDEIHQDIDTDLWWCNGCRTPYQNYEIRNNGSYFYGT